MQFIHSREYLNGGDVAVVNCDHQCNVLLMEDHDFSNFKRGSSHRYHGGFYKMLPARIPAPTSGWWNVVIHLGGGSANIRYSINVVKR